MEVTALYPLYVLLGFAFLLTAMGAKLPLEALLRVIEAHSKEATVLIALGMLLGFLVTLQR